jgi:hypothetical protein
MDKRFFKTVNNLKYWTPETFEISSYKYHLSEKKGRTFNTSGSDNTKLCTYTYNELGFRGDSINKEGFKVMSIGCSNTEGVGVDNKETWSSQFSKLIHNGVDSNFGMGGRSNDYISRCLISYYDLIKPDLVLIMYTSATRREFYTKEGGIEPFALNPWGYYKEHTDGINEFEMLQKLSNTEDDYINWYKNHLLIKYFLETKKCNWLWNGWFGVPSEYTEFNRFDGEYGKFVDMGVDNVHPGPLHNKKYAKKLKNHIIENFRNYIPNTFI